MKKIMSGTSVAAAAAFLCSTALGADEAAKDEAASKAQDSEALQTIVVTAERRSTPLQKTPISIQAFTAEDMEKKGITSPMDLQFHTPGVVMGQFMGFGQMYMRGIGMTNIAPGLDSPVAIYVDGVYQSRPFASLYGFLDVERVEILKGPQGTLYGRNATGGAVNVISKAASRELEGQADVQFGSNSQKVFRGTVSGPLSQGAAYFRFSGVSSEDDGPTKNVTLDTPGNAIKSEAYRASLELTPSAALNVVLNARYNENRSSDNFKLINEAVARSVNPAFAPGPWGAATWNNDFYELTANTPGKTMAKQTGVDATIKYDMQGARLTSITASRREKWDISSIDFDGTEKNLIIGGPITEDVDFFSQEFILASTGEGPLQWTALATYSRQKTDYDVGVRVPFFAPPPAFKQTLGDMTNKAAGIGGQVSYAFGNGLTLVAGTRYSRESAENQMQISFNGAPIPGQSQNEKKTWSASTPKLVVQYQATRDAMLYASATKGFKSGGYTSEAVDKAWDPEKVTSYEAGVKSTWLGGKLRVNAAVFDMDYKDMQMSRGVYDAFGALSVVTSNAGKSTIRGFELEVAAKPTPRLELLAGLQLLNAEFDEYIAGDPYRPALGNISTAGNPLMGAPDLAVNLGAQYTWPAAFRGADVTLRGDGYHRSRVYYTPFKDGSVGGSEDLSFLGNVQLSFEPTGNRGLYGAASIKNITDKRYHSYVRAGSGGYASFPAPERTFSLQLGYKF